jgi:ribonuclease BN (tRNA processing enzyme)
MKIRILGSADAANTNLQYVSSYVINNSIAIDAGSLGLNGSPSEQAAVRHVFLTHAHIDHIATLPFFLENAIAIDQEPVSVYGHPVTLAALQEHILNDVIWPDFVRLSIPGRQFLKCCPLKAETPVQVEGLSVLPVAVDHTVATYGYIVSDETSTVIFGADSGPTDRIWQIASDTPAPRYVFLEACFPDAMQRLARESRHLTPALVAAEVLKMPTMNSIVAVHIKPRFWQTTVDELLALRLPNLVIGLPNHDYQF